jgi:hypothetical protein
MKNKILILLYALSIVPGYGQKSKYKDSIEVCLMTNDFFRWYLNSINGIEKSVYQPGFIEDKNGMTTLDFKEYFENLKKHGCSDELMKRERESYNKCLKNIEGIKYSDFIAQYTDLDQFEKINCDFENYHRWTGGQEPVHGIRIKNITSTSNNKIIVNLEYCVDNGGNSKISYWGNNKVTMVRINKDWKIDSINWR